MSLDSLIAYCESLPGATPLIKIENHLTYNVGGKSFLWLGQDHLPISCSFKCSDEDFVALQERDGFMPAPYMARNKWIKCDDIGLLEKDDLEKYIRQSYVLMRDTLSKKLRESL